jgi:hypothetical protein
VQENKTIVQNSVGSLRRWHDHERGSSRYAVNYKKSEIFMQRSVKSIARDRFPERLSQRRRPGYTSKVTDHTSEGSCHILREFNTIPALLTTHEPV